MRQETCYNLRSKLTKNTKYYHTSISQGPTIPNLENESAKPEMVFSSEKSERGNSNMENKSAKPEMVFSTEKSETGNSNIKQRRSILKKFISSKYGQNNHRELDNLDALPMSQMKAIKRGFSLQTELGIRPRNHLLEAYLNKGSFQRNKQSTHHPHLEDKFKIYTDRKNKSKKKQVNFANVADVDDIRNTGIKISYLTILKSSFYSCSLKEINLIKL